MLLSEAAGTPGADMSEDAQVCCDGRNVYVVWEDRRNGASDIYFNCSLDAGRRWLSNDLRLDTDPAGRSSSLDPQLACDGARVCALWFDTRGGPSDIFATACEP